MPTVWAYEIPYYRQKEKWRETTPDSEAQMSCFAFYTILSLKALLCTTEVSWISLQVRDIILIISN